VPRHLYPVTVGERSGYIDSTGKTVIPLCFDDVRMFWDGLAPVLAHGLWGYIDTVGTMVITPRFEYAEQFSEGLAVVGTSEKRYYIDRTGRVAIGPKFDVGSPGKFHNGRASASIGGVGGYIDHTGSMVIRSESHSFHPNFSDGLAAMEVNGQWGFIDTTGTMVIKPQFPRDFNSAFGPGNGFRHGFAAVPIGGKWGFIDKTGRVVIPGQFDGADSFNDGLARVRVADRWGYIDTTGAVVIAPQYENTWGFSEGLAAVRVGDKWGYIDRTGRLLIAAHFEPLDRFDYVDGFWGGIARVRRRDEDGYIDRTGRFVWTTRRAGTDAGACPAELAQQPAPVPQGNVDMAALPALSPLGASQPTATPQPDSARPILYYEDLDGEVLTGLFLDGRRVAVAARPAVTMPIWSPDGAWVAFGTRDSATHAGVVAVVNLRGERHLVFAARDSIPMFPRWSPDGRFIAAILVGTSDESAEPETVPLVVISVADAAVRHRVAIPVAALAARAKAPQVRWSPDGQRVLFAGAVAVVASIGSGVVDTIARGPVAIEWNATGDALYYFAQPDSGTQENVERLGPFFVRRLAERQPKLLAGADRVVRLGVPYPFVPPSRRLILSPDSKRLALWGGPAGGSRAVVRIYDVTAERDIDIERPIASIAAQGSILALQWGPQGRGLAALVPGDQGLEVRYLDVGTGKWKKLATVRAGGAADYYGFGILSLSWTQ
jgi:hypothetical protein